MAKKIEPLKSAPELPEEVTGPIEPEEIIELDDKIDGPIDDKLADLLEETSDEPAPANDNKPDEKADEAEPDKDQAAAPEEDGIVEDEKIDEAIEEIAAAEKEEDPDDKTEKHHGESAKAVPKIPRSPSKLRRLLGSIWSDPRKRWMVLGITTFVLLALALIPHSRYFILNTARVRAGMNLRVIDGSTLQPLKNVRVAAGGAEALTDSDGVARLTGVRLGRTRLIIEKRAFESQTKSVTVGWGSNPLGDFSAQAVGSQYTIYAKDAFSGQPLVGAEAASGEGNASSDEDGKMVLVLDTAAVADDAQISIQVSAEGYRQETLNITVNNRETQSVEMVPARRHVFVSKRSGNYDVYAIDVDGKNEERIVGGTGLERSDIALVPHPAKDVAALVSTRENTRNATGYLLSTLYIVDTKTGDLVKIDQSEQIKIIGWSDAGRLVYVKIAAGASGTDPKRHRLMSFNNEDYADVKELASSNTFNDVVMAGGKVYYAPSNIFQEATPGMYVINPDGSGKQTVLDKEIYTIVRGGYDKLYLSAGNDWYQYVLGSPQAGITEAPSSQTGRVYADAPDGSSSLWVDNRDGKGVLIHFVKAAGEEKTLVERGGLKLPVYWLNDKYVVYRIADGKETADYILNTDGGEPHKITDVTDTAGVGRWLYY